MADFTSIIWDDAGDDGNVAHIAEHDLEPEDVNHVLQNPSDSGFSHSSGLPCVFGYTPDGDYIIVVYERIDGTTVYPVTAYDVDEPG